MNHWKTSWEYMRRSPFQALAAVSVLAITFFIGTILAVLVYSSNQLLTYFETRPQVIAFLKPDATIDQISTLQTKLQGDDRIQDVNYVSKEKALEIYKDATSDNPLLAELVSPSIFPASLEFSLLDLKYTQAVVDQVKSEDIVDSVGFTASVGGQENLSDVVTRLKTITLYIRIGGGALIFILTSASFLVLLVVVGLRLSSRKEEVETLDLLGATRGFIRSPVVWEAINYALLGVLAGWLMAVIIVLYATPGLISYFKEIPILPKDTPTFFALLGAILGGEVVIGTTIALLGSLIAVSRARK